MRLIDNFKKLFDGMSNLQEAIPRIFKIIKVDQIINSSSMTLVSSLDGYM